MSSLEDGADDIDKLINKQRAMEKIKKEEERQAKEEREKKEKYIKVERYLRGVVKDYEKEQAEIKRMLEEQI